MIRFLLFAGVLIGAAYFLTEPPRETALSANEAPASNDKPLLTSWGPTLGSLRKGDGAPASSGSGSVTQTAENAEFHKFGAKTELWVLGQSNGFKDPANPAAQDRGWVSDGYVGADVIAAANQASEEAERAMAEKAVKATTVASVAKPEPQRAESNEPVIDRIAAARPPRGLFTRTAATEQPAEARRGTRNRGLFARLLGRGKPDQRSWALGPAR